MSRRLARKLSESLRRGRYGYVKLVAHAYIYLLARLPPQDSALLSRELVCQEAVRPVKYLCAVDQLLNGLRADRAQPRAGFVLVLQ